MQKRIFHIISLAQPYYEIIAHDEFTHQYEVNLILLYGCKNLSKDERDDDYDDGSSDDGSNGVSSKGDEVVCRYFECS